MKSVPSRQATPCRQHTSPRRAHRAGRGGAVGARKMARACAATDVVSPADAGLEGEEIPGLVATLRARPREEAARERRRRAGLAALCRDARRWTRARCRRRAPRCARACGGSRG